MDSNDPQGRRPSPERAAVWMLGIVILAALLFVVALVVLN
jgi:hypothetical protein